MWCLNADGHLPHSGSKVNVVMFSKTGTPRKLAYIRNKDVLSNMYTVILNKFLTL